MILEATHSNPYTDTPQNETLEDIAHNQPRGFLPIGRIQRVVWICSINSALSNVVHI